MVLTSVSALAFDMGIYFGYLTQDPPTVISKEPTQVAKVVNDLTTPEDYVWFVPSDPESRLYLHAQEATHYPFVHPWILVCEECKQQILRELATNKPKIIVWYPNVILWGQNIDYYADEILQYVKANYFTVENSRQGKLRNFYFLNSKQNIIIKELSTKGYIVS